MSLFPQLHSRRDRSSRARATREAKPNLENLEGRALLAPLIANANGVTGTIGSVLWHYQDNGGWYNLNAPGPATSITSMVDSRDPYGREELFVRLNTGEVWDFVCATGQWRDTHGQFDTIVANTFGVTGMRYGLVSTYQDNSVWSLVPGQTYQLLYVVASHDPFGNDEIFTPRWDTSLWDYVLGTHGPWHNTGRINSNYWR